MNRRTYDLILIGLTVELFRPNNARNRKAQNNWEEQDNVTFVDFNSYANLTGTWSSDLRGWGAAVIVPRALIVVKRFLFSFVVTNKPML